MEWDYGLALPLIARLPHRWSHWLARIRGRLNAYFGRDWAELTLGFSYIAGRTAKTSQLLWPGQDAGRLTVKRYETVSREELDAVLIRNGNIGQFHVELSGLKNMLDQTDGGRGLVVLTAHFDSFILGMLGLGLCGRRTFVTTSNVVQDSRVNPVLADFFRQKYAGAGKYLQGGSFLHVESSLPTFYRALKHHETVVVVADAPAAADGPGEWVRWFGSERKLANGALRMATETNSLMSAMVCLTDDSGNVQWFCAEVVDPACDSFAYAKLFTFLETVILQNPGRWWASHLLQDCPVRAQND